MAAAAKAPQKLPFRKGTRLRGNSIPFNGSTAFTISAGSNPAPQQIPLPNVGLLSRILVRVSGTVTNGTGGSVLGPKAPWCLFRRLQVAANLGYAFIYDTDGWGNHLVQKMIVYGWKGDNAGIGDTVPSPDVYVFPVAAGAQTFNLDYVIPINLNQDMNCELGLINLQSPEIQVYLNLTYGQLGDFGASNNITSIAGTLELYYEFYEIGSTQRYNMPPNVVIRTLQDTSTVGTTGDFFYQVPRMGTMLQAVQAVMINGAYLDSNIDGYYYRFNRGVVPQQVSRQQGRLLFDTLVYRTNPITGAIYWDFFHSVSGVSRGDLMNAINTERIATFELVPTIDSGATFGSGNNFIDTIRRLLQPLTVVQQQQAA
jgi:hypothetical protein